MKIQERWATDDLPSVKKKSKTYKVANKKVKRKGTKLVKD